MARRPLLRGGDAAGGAAVTSHIVAVIIGLMIGFGGSVILSREATRTKSCEYCGGRYLDGQCYEAGSLKVK